MTPEHPITPPPELVREWNEAAIGTRVPPYGYSEYIATQAARWGADTELNECCHLLRQQGFDVIEDLRAARRPRPPSLAKQGCDALDTYIYGNPNHKDKERTYNTIRRALERLQELEKGNE